MIWSLSCSSTRVCSSCSSSTSRNPGINGRLRPSPSLPSPGSSRSQPASRSTWCSCRVRVSDWIRHNRDVCRLKDRLQVIRKVLQQRRILVRFEKTLSSIVLPQERDFRTQCHFACSRRQSESTLQCRELPVNRGRCGAVLLSPGDISRYSLARNIDREVISEKTSKMTEATSNALRTAATVRLAVLDQNAREIFETLCDPHWVRRVFLARRPPGDPSAACSPHSDWRTGRFPRSPRTEY